MDLGEFEKTRELIREIDDSYTKKDMEFKLELSELLHQGLSNEVISKINQYKGPFLLNQDVFDEMIARLTNLGNYSLARELANGIPNDRNLGSMYREKALQFISQKEKKMI